MNRLLVHLLAFFIPNKDKRKSFRRKLLNKNNQRKNNQNGNISSIECYNEIIINFFQNFLNKNLNTLNDLSTDIISGKKLSLCGVNCNWAYIDYLFNVKNIEDYNNNIFDLSNIDYFFAWGLLDKKMLIKVIYFATKLNKKVLFIEDGFLRSGLTVFTKIRTNNRYQQGISFTIDDLTCYYDCTRPSRLELMINDDNLIITGEQRQRARKCIDRIIKTRLTKYNHQPIYKPEIGRKGKKKVLVIDQSYGDFSIVKGGGNDNTFKIMLETAIKENPDADIIIKTHPDTIAGGRSCYYNDIKQENNIFKQTEAINPLSLIDIADKVYVCTTQFGFEALMMGKEVHTFGIPFYANWGLTIDAQHCNRRTKTRTIEELFYIVYIMYSHYVNPKTQSRCEIEEAMDYLLELRDEYFKEFNIKYEL